ncbi:DUF1330 domain-containing protein [Photobacterium lutimaris]|uniref:DUF1330 domain-containing protein n=1 Tax=Photobacterium lutimaris TaxID=388278 RepID=A0A2T3IYG2_9GAMM|nr:DUF1330 domain-containing protein [Photobacterium lutimaris]PSU33631.1 DUF1330 domain-containing protein [Photobacterium lutimaris]TDR74519.1 uncharacterized protein (DUF1330 family) [Photobacterium lutimaris]
MDVINQLYPSDKQLARLNTEPDTGEIHLLNLFKFREQAEYSDGRTTNLSGKEAYEIYSKSMVEVLNKYSAEVVFFSDITGLIIGEVDELWDAFVIVKYPSRQALLDMVNSDEFKAFSIHREAGLEGQLNIETSIP